MWRVERAPFTGGVYTNVFLYTNEGENTGSLRPLTTDATSQLDVLGHDCDSPGVNCAQVGVL